MDVADAIHTLEGLMTDGGAVTVEADPYGATVLGPDAAALTSRDGSVTFTGNLEWDEASHTRATAAMTVLHEHRQELMSGFMTFNLTLTVKMPRAKIDAVCRHAESINGGTVTDIKDAVAVIFTECEVPDICPEGGWWFPTETIE